MTTARSASLAIEIWMLRIMLAMVVLTIALLSIGFFYSVQYVDLVYVIVFGFQICFGLFVLDHLIMLERIGRMGVS